jgi:hypothetical protein
MFTGQLAYVLDCEAQDLPCLIDAFHDGIIAGLAHNSRRIGKEDLKEIALCIEPDFYSGLLRHIRR